MSKTISLDSTKNDPIELAAEVLLHKDQVGVWLASVGIQSRNENKNALQLFGWGIPILILIS